MQLSHINYFNHEILKSKRDIICLSVEMCLLFDSPNMFAFQTTWQVHVYFELYETMFWQISYLYYLEIQIPFCSAVVQ